jgi:hypothetical protein
VPGACVIQEAPEHRSLPLSAEHLLSQQPRSHDPDLSRAEPFRWTGCTPGEGSGPD